MFTKNISLKLLLLNKKKNIKKRGSKYFCSTIRPLIINTKEKVKNKSSGLLNKIKIKIRLIKKTK